MGETNFQPREFPQSGSKAGDGERRETSGGTRKAAWAKIWGESKLQPREFPQSGSKATNVEREKKERKLVITMVHL